MRPHTCLTDGCGDPDRLRELLEHTGATWIRMHRADEPTVGYCSWTCASYAAIRLELREIGHPARMRHADPPAKPRRTLSPEHLAALARGRAAGAARRLEAKAAADHARD